MGGKRAPVLAYGDENGVSFSAVSELSTPVGEPPSLSTALGAREVEAGQVCLRPA